MSQFFKDYSTSAMITGLIAVLVSYAGPLVIVFQAAQAGNLSTDELNSWIWAISIGSALSGIILSYRFKLPIITAWSTPGAAILVGSLSHYSFNEAVGAFIISSLLILLLGYVDILQKLIMKIPSALTSAMLAGILFQFGLNLVTSTEDLPLLILPMAITFLIGKRFFPTFAVMASLCLGMAITYILGLFETQQLVFALSVPKITVPTFSTEAVIGLGIPIFIVTIASQNIPGLAVLNAAGYKDLPTQAILKTTGFFSLVLAPFGSHGINLAAITAAICTGRESHKNPERRYISGIFCGLFYLLFGLFGASIAGLILALPKEFIAAIAGLALLSAMANGLSSAVKSEQHRESALITFMVTASGITIFGIGSAFWGLIVGFIALMILSYNHITTPSEAH